MSRRRLVKRQRASPKGSVASACGQTVKVVVNRTAVKNFTGNNLKLHINTLPTELREINPHLIIKSENIKFCNPFFPGFLNRLINKSG